MLSVRARQEDEFGYAAELGERLSPESFGRGLSLATLEAKLVRRPRLAASLGITFMLAAALIVGVASDRLTGGPIDEAIADTLPEKAPLAAAALILAQEEEDARHAPVLKKELEPIAALAPRSKTEPDERIEHKTRRERVGRSQRRARAETEAQTDTFDDLDDAPKGPQPMRRSELPTW